jgi:hypothetical protein
VLPLLLLWRTPTITYYSSPFFFLTLNPACIVLFIYLFILLQIFGGYASEPWVKTKQVHYGSGESFLFKIKPVCKVSTHFTYFLLCISPLSYPCANVENQIFRWSKLNDYFMYSKPDFISFGRYVISLFSNFKTSFCTKQISNFSSKISRKLIFYSGGGGYGLWIDSDFELGSSATSDTYQNEPLSTTEQFKVLKIEVWAPPVYFQKKPRPI